MLIVDCGTTKLKLFTLWLSGMKFSAPCFREVQDIESAELGDRHGLKRLIILVPHCLRDTKTHKCSNPLYKITVIAYRGLRGGSVEKNPLANAGDTRDAGLIPGSGRSPGGEHSYPL